MTQGSGVTVTRERLALPARFLAGVLAALAGTLVLFYVVMRPPAGDIQAMAEFLAITAAISVVAGYAAYRMGWAQRLPRILWALVGGYVLASVLTFLNVWVTARLMFTSQHDLLLATVLLLFAGGIAVSLGYFFSAALRDSIVTLNGAAQEIRRGRLSARVDIAGRNEVAELAEAFNGMAAQLEATAEKQRQLDTLRRDLIAWVGHDLRTPLASIRAIVEALADGVVEDPDVAQRYLRTAQRDVRALAGLIDDLFEMAQLDAGGLPLERRPNSLSDLVSDTLERFSALARERGVTLEGSVAGGVDPVVLDAPKIGRVLANLVDNALRHTAPGGNIEVHAERVPGAVQVTVTDTGEGIAPGDLGRVFEQFYRGERSRSRATGGAGLGLAIARGIVTAHGGEIGVTSQPGTGATFYFTLPKRP